MVSYEHGRSRSDLAKWKPRDGDACGDAGSSSSYVCRVQRVVDSDAPALRALKEAGKWPITALSKSPEIIMHRFQPALTVLSRRRMLVSGALMLLSVCLVTPTDTQAQVRGTTTATVDTTASADSRLASSAKSRATSTAVPEPNVMQSLNTQRAINGESKYRADVEQFAKTQGCSDPMARAVLHWPPAEMFAVDCRGTDQMLVKCERDACLEMR